MAVSRYSRKLDGGKKLAANFTLAEFACKDGSDEVLVCSCLVKALQQIREHFGKPVTITSAYRTAAHNKKVGGASNSQHLKGTAADIVVSGVPHLQVAQYAEGLGLSGIGLYGGFVHIDTRAGRSFWDQRSGKFQAVQTFGGKPAAQIVQEKAGLDDNTMKYLAGYRYGAALLEKLAKAMR